jgi:hypothetical protein
MGVSGRDDRGSAPVSRGIAYNPLDDDERLWSKIQSSALGDHSVAWSRVKQSSQSGFLCLAKPAPPRPFQRAGDDLRLALFQIDLGHEPFSDLFFYFVI